MSLHNVFIYSWTVDEKETEYTKIRAYGIDEHNKNICLHVNDLTPYVYIELPPTVSWTAETAQLLGNLLTRDLGECGPLKSTLIFKHKLYGAYIDKQGKRKKFPYLLTTFAHRSHIMKSLFPRLRRVVTIKGSQYRLKVHEGDADPLLQMICCNDIDSVGWISFSGKQVTEDAKSTLCDREYTVRRKNIAKLERHHIKFPLTMCFDIEVFSTNPSAMPKSKNPGDKIFQISCIFKRDGEESSAFLLTLGQAEQDLVGSNVNIRSYTTESALLIGFTELVAEKNPNVIAGYNILGFDIQYMIDRAKLNYCIGEFDKLGFHRYSHSAEKTIKWSSSAFKTQEFSYLDSEGRIIVDLLPLIRRDYKFNDYTLKTVSMEILKNDTKVDLSIPKMFKLYQIGIVKQPDGSYSSASKRAMGHIGKYCIKDSELCIQLMDKMQTWIGLTEMAKTCSTSIFSIYTQGQQIKVYSQVYRYCMKNNIVVEKDGYVTKENERYAGAHVFPPIPGLYNKVVPFDFQSLYPSVMIAYNFDYSTLVGDDSDIPDSECNIIKFSDHINCPHDPKVIRAVELSLVIEDKRKVIKDKRAQRDKKTNKLIKNQIIEEIKRLEKEIAPYIEERSAIKKTILKNPLCGSRHYKFYKGIKGVIPTILQNLLDARKNTRKQIKSSLCQDPSCKGVAVFGVNDTPEYCDKHKKSDQVQILSIKQEQDIKLLNSVLDKRQLAYKISANSMYGSWGVKRGYLPFMPGAMATTYMGRINIEKAANSIQNDFGGKLVYGDTDSNYVTFPHLETAQETWKYAEHVAKEVSKLFPPPMKLEFEEAIYWSFLILSKKRYMYTSCSKDGTIDQKIGKKGVVLARRDNSVFIRTIYERVVDLIFRLTPHDEIMYYIVCEINKLCSNSLPIESFAITKSVGDTDGFCDKKREEQYVTPFKDEKGRTKGRIGNYIVPLLPDDDKEERERLIKKKDAINTKDYYEKCLPAQVQLAEKIRRRGGRVETGSRIRYVIVEFNGGHKGKQYEKIESFDYFIKFRDVLTIDFLYYLDALINPLDQVLDVIFNKNNTSFVAKQFKVRVAHTKMINEIKSLSKPCLVFKD
jgi:DNA polymerase elongation subunit (family B)